MDSKTAGRKPQGGRPRTFDFFGFTNYCSRSMRGNRFRMKRITSRKKYVAKIRAIKEWLKANRTLLTRDLKGKVVAKMRGHFAYYGVTDNSRGLMRFAEDVRKLLFKWLNKRGCMKWDKFMQLLKKFPVPKPLITVNLLTYCEVCL